MMVPHYTLAEPVCCSGSDLVGKASGVFRVEQNVGVMVGQAFGVAWVEQSVGAIVGQVVEEIELEHCCIGVSTPGVVYSTEVVAEHKVEMTG